MFYTWPGHISALKMTNSQNSFDLFWANVDFGLFLHLSQYQKGKGALKFCKRRDFFVFSESRERYLTSGRVSQY